MVFPLCFCQFCVNCAIFVDIVRFAWYNIQATSCNCQSCAFATICIIQQMEVYRSGHNEAVLKTVWVQAHGGSNPSTSAKKFDKFRLVKFFYPSHRLGISSPCKVRCISSAPSGLYLITRQRVFPLRLDDMQYFVLVISNASH